MNVCTFTHAPSRTYTNRVIGTHAHTHMVKIKMLATSSRHEQIQANDSVTVNMYKRQEVYLHKTLVALLAITSWEGALIGL